MKFVIAALVVILFFWLINSSFVDRHAPETDGPLGWRNAYSLRGSALAQNSPDSATAANQALGSVVDEADNASTIPNTGQRIYTVQPGDTLSGIAQRYRVTVGQILYANPAIRNANQIYAGQPIIIPAPGSPSSQVTNPAIAQAPAVADPPASAVLPAVAVPTAASQASTIPVSGSSRPGRWILVDIASQRVTAYNDGMPVRTFIVSTGIPAYPTDRGTFQIYEKFLSTEMTGPGYDLKNVPYTMYYEQGGCALHGAYWHNNFGIPMSHGCVNLATPDAEWLYNWAPLGTTVVIQ